MFRDRDDAGRRLAGRLSKRPFRQPVVLGIPRGGVVTGAVLARDLDADLDIVLSRKLRAPGAPELAIGAVSEDGQVYLTESTERYLDVSDEYLALEVQRQLAEIKRRRELFRAVRPQAPVEGRSVIVTDDGIATGATMIAALQVLKAQRPHEVIVAVPVASPSRLVEIRQWCDDVVCLLAPEAFWAIGDFYEDFTQVDDQTVLEILREFSPVA